MATHEMGIIQKFEVRDMWNHEAGDFTPWLAENINLLGEALQMDLEFIQSESSIGPFSVDIVAKDVGRGLKVVIENQLEWTDHSHLGQLLTYAAGKDASVVVWIAPHFREEHRAAIDWLNRTTSQDIEFFAVEVRAITIEQGGKDKKETSLPAPEFRPVAFPNEWTKGNAGRRNAARQLANQQWLDFYQPLVAKLHESKFTSKASATKGGTQRFDDDCVENTYYCAWFWKHYAVVSVTMFNKELYAKLEERRENITNAVTRKDIKGELTWYNPKAFQYSEIRVRIKGAITDPPERLKEIRDWMFDSLPKFRAILNREIKNIVGEPKGDTAKREVE